MKVTVIAIGNKMPDWVQIAVSEYSKRLPSHWHFRWQALPLAKRSKASASQTFRASEGKKMAAEINKEDFVIALEVTGKRLTTEALSTQLEGWQQAGRNLVFLIGGPDGLAPDLVDRADFKWSLSDLTLPHPLVRVVLTEQLYRAHSLLSGHPYHRA